MPIKIEINYEEVKFSSTQAFLFVNKKQITAIPISTFEEAEKLVLSESTIIYLRLE